MSKVDVESDFIDLSSDHYVQSYCILNAVEKGSPMRQVLFRFGSWIYFGTVELTPTLALDDLPYIIPAVRVQHSKMKFLCDARWVPKNNCFAAALANATAISALMEHEISTNEQGLMSLIEMLNNYNKDDAPIEWLLEGDKQNFIFQFAFAPDKWTKQTYKHISIIATKRYKPGGLVSIAIYCAGKHYLTVSDSQDEHRLLDCNFPNVMATGRGFKLRSYPNGIQDWPQLRHISIWENISTSDDKSDVGIHHSESEPSSTESSDCEGVDERVSTPDLVDELNKEDMSAVENQKSSYERERLSFKQAISVTDCDAFNKTNTTVELLDKLNIHQDNSGFEVQDSEGKTNRITLVGQVCENDKQPFLNKTEVRDNESGALSVGAELHDNINRLSSDVGKHHLTSLRTPSKVVLTLINIKKKYESSSDITSEPWCSDGRPIN